MIAIIDYGVGNLFSLRSSLRRLGLDAAVTADPARIRAADRIIGNRFGSRYQQRAEITGGVILILIGLKILLEHLEIL